MGNGRARWLRRGRNLLLVAVLIAVASAAGIWLAVRLTPMQSVSAAGQNVQVGAAEPGLSGSGPGELDLFGEAIPTQPRFDGPIRPRLKLAHITLDSQVNQAFHAEGGNALVPVLSRQLAAGWKRYCIWETLVAAGCAGVIAIAVAGVGRTSPRTMLAMLAATLVTVSAANAVGVYLLASGTPRALRQVHTLDDLVGRTRAQPVAAAKGPALPGIHAVVLGDSTAAGIGNPLVDHPTALDRACGRSSDAYAADLASANGWKVLNLACQGATVSDGILGVQVRGDKVVPPQLAVAQRATGASAVIVSIGANDLNWAVLTGLCAAAPVCDDEASTAYFKEELAGFSQDYLDLLEQLAALPHHPAVLINEYYEPFGPDTGCLKKDGITREKADVLGSRLSDLNAVLESGADTFHFAVARPGFDGHRLCSTQPYVQDAGDKAPLHPTAAGQLAIALADEQALAAIEAERAAHPERTTRPSSTPSTLSTANTSNTSNPQDGSTTPGTPSGANGAESADGGGDGGAGTGTPEDSSAP
ncbi:GDSL-type esterase/lipase family protein [Actinacidiphila yanglinensis]|nr:GDSL-type esterase/lipase family protein [Actinacidiphila yanglinensis]